MFGGWEKGGQIRGISDSRVVAREPKMEPVEAPDSVKCRKEKKCRVT